MSQSTVIYVDSGRDFGTWRTSRDDGKTYVLIMLLLRRQRLKIGR